MSQERMVRIDAVGRILAQALGSYLLATSGLVKEGGNVRFCGAGSFSTTVDLNASKPKRR